MVEADATVYSMSSFLDIYIQYICTVYTKDEHIAFNRLQR